MTHKRFWMLRGLKIMTFMLFAGTFVTYLVMSLWNWLMPVIFGLTVISFWQALGLLILSKILFGWSWGKGPKNKWGGHNRSGWKHRMKEQWQGMSQEEKEAFKEKMGKRCGRSWQEPRRNSAEMTDADGHENGSKE